LFVIHNALRCNVTHGNSGLVNECRNSTLETEQVSKTKQNKTKQTKQNKTKQNNQNKTKTKG
jgi:hypothetical protein